MKSQFVVVLILLVASSCQNDLPKLNIDITQSTISGISSGGAFVQQFGFAHSSIVKGVATIAGIPFGCARGLIQQALTYCMVSPTFIDVNALIAQAKGLETKGSIDSLSNLKNQQQYYYSGVVDTVVKSGVVKKAQTMTDNLGAPSQSEYAIVSEHTWATKNEGNPCIKLGAPYISKCDYETSNVFMKQFLGGSFKEPTQQKSENLFKFSQSSYIKSGTSMNTEGYYYAPENCQKGNKCKLHVAFHGCAMTLADIGTSFATMTGLNEIAEANDLVILYPQVQKSLLNPQNPNGCWDWWGYTSPLIQPLDYLTQSAPQIQAVYKMMQALSGSSQDQQ